MKKLAEKLSSAEQPRVLVVGDVMLDRHVTCDVLGFSPEDDLAPKLREISTTTAPGGAANVANNLRAMGAKVSLVSVVGDDGEAAQLSDALQRNKIDSVLLLDESRPTTTKTRFLTKHGRHVARIDRESTKSISKSVFDDLQVATNDLISKQFDVIVVSDYAKGVVNRPLMDFLNVYRKPIIVDPKANFFSYGPAYALTPNMREYKETLDSCNGNMPMFYDLSDAVKYLVMKMSECGCQLQSADSRFRLVKGFKTNKRTLGDPTGCGDSFLAAFAIATALKWEVEEACMIGNAAGAIAYTFTGAHAVTKQELLTELCCFDYGE